MLTNRMIQLKYILLKNKNWILIIISHCLKKENHIKDTLPIVNLIILIFQNLQYNTLKLGGKLH